MTRKQTPCVQQLDSAAPDMFARLSTVAHFGWCANRNGFRERRPRKIAENYIKGWFFIDFLSCLPHEREVCYPPCTYLKPTGRTQRVEMSDELTCVVLEVTPHVGS